MPGNDVQFGIMIQQIESLTKELEQMRKERAADRDERTKELASLREAIETLQKQLSEHKGFRSGFVFAFGLLGSLVGAATEYLLRGRH